MAKRRTNSAADKTLGKKAKVARGPAEITLMQRLTATAAQWLLSMDGRTLRDQHDLPRSANGTYDAKELVAWKVNRLPSPKLTDDDVETSLRIGNHYVAECSLAVRPIAKFLGELDRKFGDAGLALFARQLLDHCQREFVEAPDYYREPSPSEIRQQQEQRAQADANRRARDRLDIVVVCDACKRLRCGRKWIKRRPPADHAINLGICDQCDS